MNISQLPFVHYLVKSTIRGDTMLVSPREIERPLNSGAFFIPTQDDGNLFPHYRFHFTIYLGNGEFIEQERGQTKLFTGVAVSARIKRRDSLILLFGLSGPEPWWFPFHPHLPTLLEENGEFAIPTLERVPRKVPVKYTGTFAHQDFESTFVELRPSQPKVFDEVLLKYHISVIGCDSKTKYEARRNRQ